MKRGLKRIGDRAFAGCKNLKSVKLPDGVEYISDSAFEGCGRVVFYCSKKSYAARYAKRHAIKVVDMNIYGPKADL